MIWTSDLNNCVGVCPTGKVEPYGPSCDMETESSHFTIVWKVWNWWNKVKVNSFLSITVTVIQSSKNGLIQWNCTTLSLSIKSNLKIRKKPLGFTSLCFCCWIFFQKYEILVLPALLNHFIGTFHNATSWENLFRKIKFYFKTMFSNSENSIFLE